MHKNYFPKCEIEGKLEPAIPFNHLGLEGAVPNKCGACEHLFEGGCTRGTDRYLHLDHGPCGMEGPTDPVIYENCYLTSKVEIPRKCSECRHLEVDAIRGFICAKDKAKWGTFSRGLDWGGWEPGQPYLQLPLPKETD